MGAHPQPDRRHPRRCGAGRGRSGPGRSRGGRGRAGRAGAPGPAADGRGGRPTPSATGSTCSCRPAPAPASRWPTSCRPCSTTSASSSPPRRWRSSTSWSSATSPRLVEAVSGQPGVDASYAVLKGRSNYACLHRIREGVPDDQGALVERAGRARWARRCSSCAPGPSRRPTAGGPGSATTPPGTPTGSGAQVSRQPPRVPGRGPVPLRRGVLRRAGPREGACGPT